MYKSSLVRRTINKPEEKLLILYYYLIKNDIKTLYGINPINNDGISRLVVILVSSKKLSKLLNVNIKTIRSWQEIIKIEYYKENYDEDKIPLWAFWVFLYRHVKLSLLIKDKNIDDWMSNHIKIKIISPLYYH